MTDDATQPTERDRPTNVTRKVHNDRDGGCTVRDAEGRCRQEIVEDGSAIIDAARAVYYFGYCEDHRGFDDA